ncbi:CBS domain-containing protein [bacterium]|nr:CBS domain-containing protein [bacterium]
MNVFDFITLKHNTSYIESDSTVRQALEKMDQYKLTNLPVIDKDGKYVDSISEGDVLRFMKNKANFNKKLTEKTYIKDVPRYRSCEPLGIRSSFTDLFNLSLEQNFIPIVDDLGTYIGIVKRKDIIKSLSKYMHDVENEENYEVGK